MSEKIYYDDIAPLLDEALNKEAAEQKAADKSVIAPKNDAVTATDIKAEETPVVKTEEKTVDKPAEIQPTFDESKYIFETFGGKFKSKDELLSAIGEIEKVTDLSKQLEVYQKEYIKPTDLARKINEIEQAKGDVNLFLKFNSIDLNKLSDADAIKYRLQWEKGLSPEEADLFVSHQYKVDTVEDEITGEKKPNEEQLKVAGIKMKLEGGEAKSYIQKLQVQSAQTPDVAKIESERIEKWKPAIGEIANSAKDIKFSVEFPSELNMDKVDFAYSLDGEEMKEITKFVSDATKYPNFFYDEKSKEDMADAARNRAVVIALPKILKAYGTQLIKSRDALNDKRTGSTSESSLKPASVKETGKSVEMALLEVM